MSIAQIPSGTIVPTPITTLIDRRTVIPVGAILKENTIVSEPLKGEIDFRDPKNKKGVSFVPPNSTIPDGVFLPKGTFIPQAVPVGTILPDRTILPRGSKIQDSTIVPYGSIVADGTLILEKDVSGSTWDQVVAYTRKLFGYQSNTKRHIPMGTYIPLEAVFPVGSVILEGTRIQKNESVKMSVPQGTRILNNDALLKRVKGSSLFGRLFTTQKDYTDKAAVILSAVVNNKGARLPEKPIVTTINNYFPDAIEALLLPLGVVIPKFSDGRYATLVGDVCVPLLENGSPSEIPVEFSTDKPTEKEENNIAKGTFVPKGCSIPPGTVIPRGAYFPPDTIVYLPKRADSAPILVPPCTHIPVGAIISEKLSGTDLNIPYGTYIPESSTSKINIVPEMNVPDEFQLHPAGEVKNVHVAKGTYIPKTDLPINIPQGTIIPAEAEWVVADKESYYNTASNNIVSARMLGVYFGVIHLFLTVYALSIAFQEYGNVLGITAALVVPEIYLLVMYHRNPRAVASDARLVNLLIFMLVVILLWSARIN
jgi:hypothetical protein